jgi:uncharacterized protein
MRVILMLLTAVCLLVSTPFVPSLSGSARACDLIAAAEADDRGCIARLVRAGADLDRRDRHGRTALLIAVDHNHVEFARALIAAGAGINVQAANRDTPWLLAGAQGRTEILREMIPAGPDLRIRNRFGGSALIPACERGHVETVRLLLTTPIDVNHINDLGWTCLLEIVILGDGGPRHVAAARLVLAAGADPNLADRNGVTPLAHARARSQTEIARLLESAGGRPVR